jgi:hypothetical protein
MLLQSDEASDEILTILNPMKKTKTNILLLPQFSVIKTSGTIYAQQLHVYTANQNSLYHLHVEIPCAIYEPLRPFNHLCS